MTCDSFCLILGYSSVPLVISAIINVAQDVDEDWILEVISHDGIAVNITMEPGSMVLYESHSILHGRPYPLKGRFFANCFLHFEPIGYSSELKHRMEKTQSTRDKYETAFAQQQQQHQQNSQQKTRHNDRRLVHRTLPSFIQERTVEASRWRQEFVFFRVEIAQPWTKPKTPGANNAHMSAARDDVDRMREIASTDPASLLAADINGWTPFHEAARGGNVNAMLYLLHEHNVDVNERTNKGRGGSPLWWAEQELPDGHLALDVLRQHGAVAIPPERKLLSK